MPHATVQDSNHAATHYSCHAFHDSLEKGRAGGKLSIHQHFAVVEVEGKTLQLSLQQTQAKMGGANNRLIFFSHPQYPDWTIYTNERSVLNDVHLAQHPEIFKSLKAAKRHHVKGWALIVAVCFLVLAVPAFLLFRMDVVSHLVARQVPAEWEQSLGNSTLAQFKIGQEFMEDKKAEALLDPLTSVLITALPSDRYEYQFYIVKNSTINAFALPGGNIVIHSELILKSENAEELLGVLAHEMMHVENQHGIRNVIGAAGIYVVIGALFGDVSGIMAVISSASPILLNSSYSRKFESEADRDGLFLLNEAGVRPEGIVTFFSTLQAEEEKRMDEVIEDKETQKTMKDVMGYIASHPATEKRIEQLRALIQEIPPIDDYRDMSSEFDQLQLAVEEFAINEEDVAEDGASSLEASAEKKSQTNPETSPEK